MAQNVKYFRGDVELVNVFHNGRKAFGSPADFVPFWTGKAWERGTVEADRKVIFKARPSLHECDARCTNATGRTMQCECSCGGKNHGKFSSSPAF